MGDGCCNVCVQSSLPADNDVDVNITSAAAAAGKREGFFELACYFEGVSAQPISLRKSHASS